MLSGWNSETNRTNFLAAAMARSTSARDMPLPSWFNALADAIIECPEAHVDVLVAAGVLELVPNVAPEWLKVNDGFYRVVQPHKHEWCIDAGHPGNGVIPKPPRSGDNPLVRVRCLTCPVVDWVSGRLPIEVPE